MYVKKHSYTNVGFDSTEKLISVLMYNSENYIFSSLLYQVNVYGKLLQGNHNKNIVLCVFKAVSILYSPFYISIYLKTYLSV